MVYKAYSSKRCTIRLHLGDCMDAMCIMDAPVSAVARWKGSK